MQELKEAHSLHLDYDNLTKLAIEFDSKINIRDIFSLDKFIELMGGEVTYYPILLWEKSMIPFVTIENATKFSICLCNGVDEEMKRLMLVQAIAHYILHGQSGSNPCKVSKMSSGEAAREGFIFTLLLLIPDKIVAKMIEDKFSYQQIARIFRVPEKIVAIKHNVLKKYNIIRG